MGVGVGVAAPGVPWFLPTAGPAPTYCRFVHLSVGDSRSAGRMLNDFATTFARGILRLRDFELLEWSVDQLVEEGEPDPFGDTLPLSVRASDVAALRCRTIHEDATALAVSGGEAMVYGLDLLVCGTAGRQLGSAQRQSPSPTTHHATRSRSPSVEEWWRECSTPRPEGTSHHSPEAVLAADAVQQPDPESVVVVAFARPSEREVWLSWFRDNLGLHATVATG